MYAPTNSGNGASPSLKSLVVNSLSTKISKAEPAQSPPISSVFVVEKKMSRKRTLYIPSENEEEISPRQHERKRRRIPVEVEEVEEEDDNFIASDDDYTEEFVQSFFIRKPSWEDAFKTWVYIFCRALCRKDQRDPLSNPKNADEALGVECVRTVEQAIDNAFSLTKSSVWEGDFSDAIHRHPFLAIHKLAYHEQNSCHCLACPKRDHMATHRVTFFGTPYRKEDLHFPIDQVPFLSKCFKTVSFPIGPLCYQRVQDFHRIYHIEARVAHAFQRMVSNTPLDIAVNQIYAKVFPPLNESIDHAENYCENVKWFDRKYHRDSRRG